MNKNILILLVASLLMVCAPVSLCAQELKAQSEKAETQKNQQDAQKSSMENDVQSVAISVTNSNVHIKNAANSTVEVYNIAGVKVKTQHIDSDDKTVELSSLPKGCYMLKIGKVVRKVYLK